MSKLLLIPMLLILAPMLSYADGDQQYGISDIYKNNYVKFGTTVTFVNTDLISHTITGTDSKGYIVTSGIILPGEKTQMTFSKIGEFYFYDQFNNKNTGSISVYNTLADLDTFKNSLNAYQYRSAPTFILISPPPVINNPVIPITPSVTPTITAPTIQPIQNATNSTNSTITQNEPTIINSTSTTNSTSITNSTGTTNQTTNNNSTPLMIEPTSIGLPASTPWTGTSQSGPSTPYDYQAEITKLNNKIDSMQTDIDTLKSTQTSIFGMLVKLLHIYNLN